MIRVLALAGVLAFPAAHSLSALEMQQVEESPQARTLQVETSVGMRVRVNGLPLPGTLLRAQEVHDAGKADALVRVIHAEPMGDGFLYDFEFTPYVPGSHDLRTYLEREDHSAMSQLPPLPVTVVAVLPRGRIEPTKLLAERPGRMGGYRNQMVLAGILWVLGLFLIFYLGQRKRHANRLDAQAQGNSLAQRLRPLVERAQRGELSDAERAGLERLLFAYWRERRGLAGLGISEALGKLQSDAEAGPLLKAVERWLHRPLQPGEQVDVATLLEPYRDAPDFVVEAS